MPTPSDNASPSAKPATLRHAGEILLVDDEPRNLQLLGNLLFQHGYGITLAGSGAQALDAARNARPDLILMDVMMPSMDGFETTRRLKKDEALREVPVIFLTAKSESEDVRTGFLAGGVDYVVKPFQAEELLLRIHTHLELKLAREGLAQANAQLRAANETQARFISMIAHDLRNPFHALRMFPDFVLNYGDTAGREAIEHLARESVREIDRVSRFFEEMLEWALMQMNLLEVRPEPLDLAAIIEEIRAQALPSAQAKELTIKVELPEGLPARGDRKMIATVIRNLISNSVKFTHRGGEITVRAASTDQERVLVEVIDTGIGIPDDLRAKLFSLDERVTVPGTEREKGSGLGLILCQQFLARHDSEFHIQTTPGQGSTFGFILAAINPSE